MLPFGLVYLTLSALHRINRFSEVLQARSNSISILYFTYYAVDHFTVELLQRTLKHCTCFIHRFIILSVCVSITSCRHHLNVLTSNYQCSKYTSTAVEAPYNTVARLFLTVRAGPSGTSTKTIHTIHSSRGVKTHRHL